MTKNRLANETSPYLLQHKDNPVHWYAWSDDAFAAARNADMPILVSIGYAACHWCHVMAHESFEDPDTADLMNTNFINIKVDREERPDVDKIYMDAIHALGEQGGWPLNVFLAPDGTPFWGGTYFPPDNRYGRPSFKHVLTEIARIWKTERDKVTSNCTAITQALKPRPTGDDRGLTSDALDKAADIILGAIDPFVGGLKGAPKFPQASILDFLNRHYLRTGDERCRTALNTTLTSISQGGIYDHLAGGIARYTVDDRWLVPHFEKMLYDNAQFIERLGYEQHSENNLFRIRLDQTVHWLISDMYIADAGFASSYDADSEGEEGKYYVWTEAEIDSLLPDDQATLIKRTYDVTPGGNWEGKTILNRLGTPAVIDETFERELSTIRQPLLAARSTRQPPGFDDKILADWNGLTIKALATAGLIGSNDAWIEQASIAFASVIANQWSEAGLFHTYRDGQARHPATADGYANLIAAALALYQATTRSGYIETAQRLEQQLIDRFWSNENSAFYFSAADTDHLIVRSLYGHDDATPNANATMLSNYARLGFITGNTDYLARADQLHNAFAGAAIDNPFAYAGFLAAFHDRLRLVQITLAGDPEDERYVALEHQLRRKITAEMCLRYVRSLADLSPADALAAATRSDQPAIYICVGQTCSLPAHTPEHLHQTLAEFVTRGV